MCARCLFVHTCVPREDARHGVSRRDGAQTRRRPRDRSRRLADRVRLSAHRKNKGQEDQGPAIPLFWVQEGFWVRACRLAHDCVGGEVVDVPENAEEIGKEKGFEPADKRAR